MLAAILSNLAAILTVLADGGAAREDFSDELALILSNFAAILTALGCAAVSRRWFHGTRASISA
jgi:hypothetical protein